MPGERLGLLMQPGRPPAAGYAAVLGKPVSHSLSPLLHRAAYRALDLTAWRYEAIECGEDALAALLAASGPEVAGYSCTMPLKRRALELANDAGDMTLAIGSANTLLRTPTGWRAENTDWIGIRDALAPALSREPQRAVVLGAGGTAQAALAYLAEVDQVTVLVRDPGRAAELRATASRLGRPVDVLALFGPAGELTDQAGYVLARADLVIATLPPHAADPVAALAAQWMRPHQVVLDVAYDPWPSVLASTYQRAGAAVVSGAAMLLYQAARQVELMTGRAAPVPAMRAAIAAAVPGFSSPDPQRPA